MNQFFYVYALIDPRNNQPFYIGKGSRKKGYQRIKAHFREHGKKDNPFKASVIDKIESLGLIVRIEILSDNLSEEDAFSVERIFISFYGRRDLGKGLLTNLTNGGEGTSGKVSTKEYREKRSLMSKKFWENEEFREEARQRLLCRFEKDGSYKHSDIDKKKMSESQQKRFEKQSGTMKGKKHTEETKKKMSKIRKKAGCNLPPDQRWRFGSPKEKNHFAKKTVFINPDGEEFEVVGEFRKFISDNGLSLDIFKKYLNKGIIPPAKTTLSKARIKSSGWQVKRV